MEESGRYDGRQGHKAYTQGKGPLRTCVTPAYLYGLKTIAMTGKSEVTFGKQPGHEYCCNKTNRKAKR